MCNSNKRVFGNTNHIQKQSGICFSIQAVWFNEPMTLNFFYFLPLFSESLPDNVTFTGIFLMKLFFSYLQVNTECPDWTGHNCNHQENTAQCRIETKSGSCHNCGAQCPMATSSSQYKCCLDLEIPPTRIPVVRNITQGSCDYRRFVNQWVCENVLT